ncbi:MAG: hypothetical protein ACRDZR_00645 [Acidimicrobiales bacterium]
MEQDSTQPDDGPNASDGGASADSGIVALPDSQVAAYPEQVLSRRRARDAESNRKTTPPEGEVVTLQSLTVSDVFVGPAVDAAAEALSRMAWNDTAPPFADEVRAALLGHKYYRMNFYIRKPGCNPATLAIPCASAALPADVDEAYGELSVLGPSLVVIVMTFVFNSVAAGRMNDELHKDGSSTVTRLSGRLISTRDAHDDKRRRVWAAHQDLTDRCLRWAKDTFPGTLSAVQEGLGRPTCGLMSLAKGKPFSTHEHYMAILGLVNKHSASSLRNHDYLYWTSPLVTGTSNISTVVYNEDDAAGPGGYGQKPMPPEAIHEIIFSIMVINAIFAGLQSFSPQLRDVRSQAIRLDLRTVKSDTVAQLRADLLDTSGKLAAFIGDVRVLARERFTVWSDLEGLQPLVPTVTNAPGDPVAANKSFLASTADSLLADERSILEHLLAVAEAKSDAINTDLQQSMRRLARWVAGLTAVIALAAVVTLVIALMH